MQEVIGTAIAFYLLSDGRYVHAYTVYQFGVSIYIICMTRTFILPVSYITVCSPFFLQFTHFQNPAVGRCVNHYSRHFHISLPRQIWTPKAGGFLRCTYCSYGSHVWISGLCFHLVNVLLV